MLYKDFIKFKKNENKALANEIFDKNKKVYNIKKSESESYADIVVAIKMILKLNDEEIRDNIITDGDKDGGVDAIYINNRKRVISIFDVKRSKGFERPDIINNFIQEFKKNFLDKNRNLTSLNNLANLKISEARNRFF